MAVEYDKQQTERQILETYGHLLPEACLPLPPDCQIGVINVLVLAGKMKERDSRSVARTPDALNEIISPYLPKFSQESMSALKTFKRIGHSWTEAREVAWGEAAAIAYNIGREAAFAAAQDAGMAAAPCEARWDVAEAAAWEVVKDQPGFKENPFSPLLALYGMGAVGINFRQVNDQEKLVVDFPLKVGEKVVRGCLVFGDGEPGDEEVKFIHDWGEDCSEIRPLNPPQPVRIIRWLKFNFTP